jgi:hypothetical protein
MTPPVASGASTGSEWKPSSQESLVAIGAENVDVVVVEPVATEDLKQ